MGKAETQACTKVIARILKDTGFTGTMAESLDMFTEVYALYMEELFTRIHMYCEHSTRTKPNLNDVRLGLADMGLDVGDLAAYVDTLKQKGRIESVSDYADKTVKPDPVSSLFFQEDRFKYVSEPPPRPSSIPSHLPPFPSPHTFVANKISNENDEPSSILRAKQAEQSRQVEDNLTQFLEKASHLLYARNANEDYDALPVNYETSWRRKRKAWA
ncbi:uncharacterized protein SPPG_07252 [Spizellomyces punctatus DAOM BR117]|uniref:Transcription initiation factor TFIID subunit 8 n=1 Tax=Spizellomyces punctatus (strain DAOM BR117) TaxID=645134 RepID=A0A0L0H9J4_SPIPD|nr:uncharacterized protein SPPG_07252 [Spizellomyces punctatus DAOM BR117]KNC97323.1 hypothetical protein SPPG_07252 [Spizellomyces punctatus DAOM BR117]|eukprot:XP_016605363.1 hypothetical protein SPPG_07252 [Spizellomyces punctatus DAOM BR117]